MKNISKILAATFMVVLTASHVQAQGNHSDGTGSTAPISMKDVDINQDGKVSPEESRAYIDRLEQAHALKLRQEKEEALRAEAERIPAERPKLFHPADLDKDGVVTDAERAAYLKRSMPAQPVPAPVKTAAPKEMVKTNLDAPPNDQKKLDKRLQEMKALDANHDGILQASELQKSTASKFDSADTNKDGILSPAETSASLEKFKLEKETAYGKASAKQEAARIKNRYKNADKDNDGQVSKKEYQSFIGDKQSNFDRNQDGVITEDEYRTEGEKIPSSYRKNMREEQ